MEVFLYFLGFGGRDLTRVREYSIFAFGKDAGSINIYNLLLFKTLFTQTLSYIPLLDICKDFNLIARVVIYIERSS